MEPTTSGDAYPVQNHDPYPRDDYCDPYGMPLTPQKLRALFHILASRKVRLPLGKSTYSLSPSVPCLTHPEFLPAPKLSGYIGTDTFLTLPHELRQMIILESWLSQDETQRHPYQSLQSQLQDPRAWLNNIS